MVSIGLDVSDSPDLFGHARSRDPNLVPLAERARPRTLDDVVGQDHLTGPGRLLRRVIDTRLDKNSD